MTKKDLIEEIIQNMPEGLTKLEQARYIYIKLGRQMTFDTRYYYGNASTRKRVYKEAQVARNNPQRLRNKRTIICVTLSQIYKNALKQIGIDCDIIPCGVGRDKHVLPIVYLDDEIHGKIKIRADLQQDLEAIQMGMSTVEFGNITLYEREYDIISESELKRIDKKIGYIKDNYRDTDIRKARKEVREMNANESLRYILQNPKLYANANFNGQVERRKYYRILLDTLIPHYTDKKVYMFTCYKQKDVAKDTDEENREFTLCAYSYENDDVNAYLYSSKEERFLPVTLEKLNELQNNGLNLGVKRKTKGVNLLKKFIKKSMKQINEDDKTKEEQER